MSAKAQDYHQRLTEFVVEHVLPAMVYGGGFATIALGLLLVLLTGWNWLDPLLALGVSLLLFPEILLNHCSDHWSRQDVLQPRPLLPG